jgi:DNA-binding MarR family transcriptional regulator
MNSSSDIASVLRRGTARLGSRLRAERPAGALTPTKIAVLARLHRDGATGASRLAAALFLQPQSLTRALAELERDGLILRTRSTTDGRQVLLGVTEEGIAVLRADMRSRDAWLAGALEALTETEREVLRLAGLLMERLAEEE